MTSIVQNQWYVAAYGREIGRELFSRTICGESILFWRTEAGQVTVPAITGPPPGVLPRGAAVDSRSEDGTRS